MSRPTRVAIYGSCVSRDTFEFMPKDKFSLQVYIARQSLISAFAPASLAVELPPHVSRFQRRMLEDDVKGTLPQRLRAVGGTVDLLLWDLTDERMGVYALAAGGYVTRTPEVVAAGLDERLSAEGRLVPFGGDEHFRLWTEAFEAWALLLRETHLLEKVLLVDVPWAERAAGADVPVPKSFGVSPSEANRMYDRYYATIRPHLRSVRLAGTHVQAAPDHRWGLAPFHYHESVYRHLVEAITGSVKPEEDR